MMGKIYETPVMEVIVIKYEDVITTSGEWVGPDDTKDFKEDWLD